MKRIVLDSDELCDNCQDPVVPETAIYVVTPARQYAYCNVECRSKKWIDSESWPTPSVRILEVKMLGR